MRHTKKWFFALLTLCLALLFFTACSGDDKEETRRQSAILGEDDELTAWATDNSIDFGGEKIVISLSKYTSGIILNQSTQYIEGPDKVSSDPVMTKILERNERISSAIGIEPRYVYTNVNYVGIIPDIEQKVLAPGKDTPDLYIDQAYGLVRSQIKGHLKNVYGSESEKSYVDFSVDGWYADYMSAFNFGSQDKLYMLAGDYFMDVLRFTNTIGCNLSLFDDIFPKEGGRQYLYRTVSAGDGKTGGFTYDVLTAWCEAAYKDADHNGSYTEGDRVGLYSHSSGPAGMGFMPTCDVSLYNINENGTFSVFEGPDKRSLDAVITIRQLLLNTKGVYYNPYATNAFDSVVTFVNKGALFISGMLLFYLENEEFRQMEDDKCVIPYPKLYESDTEYVTTTHDNARMGAILASSNKLTEVTAWVQAMALTSGDVRETYYQGALKFKYGTDAGTTHMLDTVYNTISAPYWIICDAIPEHGDYNVINPISHMVYLVKDTNTYVSDYQSARTPLRSALAAYMTEFSKLK